MKKGLITLTILLLTGCTNIKSQTETLSDAITTLMYDCSYDITNLNKENQNVLSNFLENEKFENKVINISSLNLFKEDGRDLSYPTTNGVYKENDEYFIKYSDLNFVKKDSILDTVAFLYVEGYPIALAKDEYPIIQTDTCNNTNYKFRYMKRKKEKNYYNYYYRSYGNGSMLTIKYKLNKNKIENIDLVFNKYYVEN